MCKPAAKQLADVTPPMTENRCATRVAFDCTLLPLA